MAKKDAIDPDTRATETPAMPAADRMGFLPSGLGLLRNLDTAEPAAGGSYTRDPATGALTCATPATADRAAMRKVQDPVTGAITRVPFTKPE